MICSPSIEPSAAASFSRYGVSASAPRHGEGELLDVLRSHAGQEVEALDAVGADAGHRGGRQAAARQQRGAGERVRSAAGEADRHELAGPERVENLGHVARDVGDPAAGPRRGPLVAGSGRHHDPQPAFLGRADDLAIGYQSARRPLVHHERESVFRADRQHVDVAAVGEGNQPSFSLHAAKPSEASPTEFDILLLSRECLI